MTTVEGYRTTQLELISDAPTNAPRSHSSTKALKRRIPPAVPSPPQQSSQYSPPRKPQAPRQEYTNTMASEDSNQWLFTEAELAHTPSVLDGISVGEERFRRAKGVNFIIQAGILLKLPQLTLATASVFFHRFYMRWSMVPEKEGLHHYNIAATSLFLATKTEENCRKTKEIVIAVAKVAQKNASLIIDEQSKEYWRWRDSILLYEELMLEQLTFDVVLHSPYNSLYQYLQKLQVEDNKPLRNAAWAFLNDSFLTTMCLLIPPKDIAVAAVYFAAKYTQSRISDDENGSPWWEQLGGKPELITKAVAVINEFYSENPLKRSENPYERSPSSVGNEEDLDRTRARNENFNAETPNSQDLAPSQRTQNGHHEGESPPAQNGNKSDHGRPGSPTIPAQATSSALTNGNSDVPLKEAANDPATHEANGDASGLSALLPPAEGPPNPTPKRKGDETADEPDSKRPKTELSQEPKGHPTTSATGKADEDESEEGELEE